jgi:hypothetical protein
MLYTGSLWKCFSCKSYCSCDSMFHEVACARCKTLKQAWCFTRLLATLWESSALKALLWGAKAPVVASSATVSHCHRHFFSRRVPRNWDSLFCIIKSLKSLRSLRSLITYYSADTMMLPWFTCKVWGGICKKFG